LNAAQSQNKRAFDNGGSAAVRSAVDEVAARYGARMASGRGVQKW
jgi:hypothetical protein